MDERQGRRTLRNTPTSRAFIAWAAKDAAMLATTAKALIAGSLALVLAGCGDASNLPAQQAQGPNPTLPEPDKSLVPTVHIAPAIGWSAGEKPIAASGLQVTAF